MCFLVVSGVHLVLQNYPQGKENTYPAKGGKPENRRHRLWHRNGRMKPKNTKRSSMRSGSVLAGKKFSKSNFCFDPPGLGIGRVGGGFLESGFLESSENDPKKKMSG